MSNTEKRAVVTGGTGGIGTAICQRLAREGVRVVATEHPSRMEAMADWCAERDAETLEIPVVFGDVANALDAARMMTAIQEQYGPVDILVNCAGITRDRLLRRLAVAQWDEVIQTNLNSAFYCTKPLWEGMLKRGFGRIINISSVNGQRGQAGQTNYAAAKAGLHGFTMALAQEGATKGVTVNTVSPGYVATPMTQAMEPAVLDAIIAGIPMKRMGLPEEIAHAVAFLADPRSGYITGANLPVNGGLFMH
ncbi:Acetoacetyl-CoA reductase [Gammaproteobacteria bacterium]